MKSYKFSKAVLFTSLSVIIGAAYSGPTVAGIIDNAKSTYSHTIDGLFTDWTTSSTATYEWFDITPHIGQYSNVYVDYDGATLFIMNDWFVNTEGSDPTNYNFFKFWTDADTWELYVFGDGTTDLKKNGVDDPSATGAYGFAQSPLMSTDHTMWEVSIDVGPGTIYMDPFDPTGGGPPTSNPPTQDPAITLVNIVARDGGGNTSTVPEPATALLLVSGMAGLTFSRRRMLAKQETRD